MTPYEKQFEYEKRFAEMILSHTGMMNDLRLIRQTGLPEAYIAAGYVRNYVWDRLHGYTERKPLNDIDVIYYDRSQLDEDYEKQVERELREMTGSSLWSVKNQARMHLQNGDPPYSSVEHAISFWPEAVTAIAIRLEADDRLSWLCPYGLNDLFELRVRRSPLFSDEAYYRARVEGKNWRALWPLLQIEL